MTVPQELPTELEELGEEYLRLRTAVQRLERRLTELHQRIPNKNWEHRSDLMQALLIARQALE